MIYLDSAALVKLIRAEAGSAELVAWLRSRPGEPLVSSALVEVEVPRALRRTEPAALAAMPAALANVNLMEIDGGVRGAAGALADPALRSLDAIHLATAAAWTGELRAFVSYDARLLRAAAGAGLPVVSPGVH